MYSVDQRFLLSQVQPFMTRLLMDECAIKTHPKSEVEEAVSQFYLLSGMAKPQFVWVANPWQMHFAPGFITGYDRKQIRIFDLQVRFAEEFRKQVKLQIGEQTFNVLHNAIQSAIPIREFLYLSRFTETDEHLVQSETELTQRNPRFGKLLLERMSATVLRPKLKLERGILEKIGKGVSWFAIEHFSGQPSPWRSKPFLGHHTQFDDPEIAGIINWGDGPIRRPDDPQPMIPRNRGEEWTSYLRMHLAFAEFCRTHLEMKLDSERARQFNVLSELTRTTNLLACFPEVCFICESPLALHRDEQNRFHCVTGPAIAYHDEYDLYFWHNTRVPARAITFDVNVQIIDNERNLEVMRVLLERYGIERYLQDTGAICFHEDETGTLYRMEKEQDILAFVGVTNSTAEVDGTHKRYFLQVPPTVATAREAVAWTFNLPASEYNPVVET